MRTALILSLAATMGCESDSAVKVFNAAPEAAITSHEDGAAVKEATEILFLGAGSDPDHSVDELEGSWQSGASPLCEWTPLQADGVSECAVTASVLLTEITFLVRDPTDSVASASISLTPTPDADPSVEITSPVYDPSSDEGLPFFWGDEPVELVGIVSDEEDQADTLSVEWTSSLEDEIEESAADSSGTTRASAYLSEGIHTVTLTVTDSAGNYNSDTIDIQVGPDNPAGAPNVAITSPLAVDGERPFYYSDQPIEFEGLVTDDEDSPDALGITWSSDTDGELAVAIPDSDGQASLTTTLSQGLHTITLSATDSDGKTGSDDINIEVGPNNTPPTCNLITPEDGEIGYLGDLVVFGGTVEDPDIAVDTLTVEWKDGDTVIGTSIPSSTGNVSLALTDLTLGAHVISMTVADEMGATCTDNVVYEVVEPPEENRPPEVSISSSAVGGSVTEGTVVLFTAEVSDPEDAPTDLRLEWTSDRLVDPLNTDPADSTGAAGFATSSLPVGTHTITLTVTDSEGLFASAMLLLDVNMVDYDTTPPTVSITNPGDVSEVTEGDIVLFAATVGDAETAISDLDIEWNSSLDGRLEGGLADDSGYVAFTSDELSLGTHSITITVTDEDDLTANAMVIVTVVEAEPEAEPAENTAPTVSITNPVDGSEATVGDTVLFAATIEDAEDDLADLIVTWNSSIDGELEGGTIDPSGYVYFTDTGLSLGTHTITVSVTDTEGLTGNGVTILNVVEEEVVEEEEPEPEENTAPSVTVSNPIDGAEVNPDDLVLFAARISDAEDDVSELSVLWKSDIDGTLTGSTPDASGYIHFTETGLSLGTHTITVMVTDTEGLAGTGVAILNVVEEEVVEEEEEEDATNTAPVVTLLNPTDGRTVTPEETVLFAARISDAEQPVSELTVTWSSSLGDTLEGGETDDSGYVHFFRDGLTLGTHIISVTVSDGEMEGNAVAVLYVAEDTADEEEEEESIDTGSETELENTPPTVSITAPTSGSESDAGDTVLFTATVDDAEDWPEDLLVEWTSDIDGILDTTGSDSSGYVAFTSSALSSGTHTITIVVMDSEGRMASQMILLGINAEEEASTDTGDASEEEEEEEDFLEPGDELPPELEGGTYAGCDAFDLDNLVIFGAIDAALFCACGFDEADNVKISSSGESDLDLSCLDIIDGELEIDLTGANNIDLSNVASVGDSINIHDNYETEVIDLSSMTSVGGNFSLSSNQDLEELTLTSLDSIDGQLYLNSNNSLATFAAPSLTLVESSIQMNSNNGLKAVQFDSLELVEGSIQFEWNNYIEEISMPKLTELDGQLYLYYNERLEAAYFDKLVEVGSNLQFQNNYALEDISLPSLTTVNGSLSMNSLNQVSDLSLPELLEVNGSFSINNMGKLDSLTAPLFFDLSSSLTLRDNGDLAAVDLSSLVCIDDFTIVGNNLEPADLHELLLQLSCDEDGGSEVVFRSTDADALCADGEDIVVGDLYIYAIDPEPLDLSCIIDITGSLEIEFSDASIINLSRAAGVGDTINIHDNYDTEEIWLDSMVSVGESFSLSSNNNLDELNLDALQAIGGQFYMNSNGALTTVYMPELLLVEGSVQLNSNNGLQVIDMPNLIEIEGSLQLEWNNYIEEISMPDLVEMSGQLYLYYNERLQTAEFNKLTEVGSNLQLQNNYQLETVSLDNLQTVNGSFSITSANQMSSMNLPELLEINGSFNLSNNSQIESFKAANLAEISSSLTLRDNSDLQVVDLSSLECLDDFTIVGNDLTVDSHHALLIALTCSSDGSLIIFRASDADDFCDSGETVVEDLYISPIDTGPVDLSCITEITGKVEMEFAKADSIDLQNVVSIAENLNIHDNYDTETIDFTSLATIGEGFTLSSNRDLSELTLTSLEIVDGQLYLNSNNNLSSLSAPELTELGGSFQMNSNNGIEEVVFNKLTKVDGSVQFEWNNYLEHVSMPNLTEISGQLYLYYNERLESADFTSLQETNSNLQVQNNYQLETLTLTNLKEVNGSFSVTSANQIETLQLEALQEVNGSFNVSNCSSLVSLYAPALYDISSSITIRDNSDLNDINLDSLTCVSDYTIAGNDMDEDDARDLLLHIISEC